MKRILFMLPSLCIGGLERVQVTIANALVKQGYDVTVMIFDEGEELLPELLPEVHFVHKRPKFRLLKKIPKIRYYFDDGLWETRATPEQLHRYYVGNEKYDVEIAFFRGRSVKTIYGGAEKNNNDFSGIAVHRGMHITRHIAWVHSDFRRAGGVMANFHSMDEVREAYRKFDKVVCVSEEAKQGFIETVGNTNNLTVIYNMLPVDEIRTKAELEPEVKVKRATFHIVLVGRLLDSAKGQIRLISAVAKLHDEGYDISLALVGSGPDDDKIRTQIANNSAEAYITMTGNQVNPYPYIKEADLLVCASYFEGFNLTVAEALVVGTPVLSTRCTGPVEILKDGEYGMVVDNSEEGLYKGLNTILDNPNALTAYGKKCAERGADFDEEKIMTEIERILI